MRERLLLAEIAGWFDITKMPEACRSLENIAECNPLADVRRVLQLFTEIALHIKVSGERGR